MIISCPECSHSVSDKATQCPNCGYPMISPKKLKVAVKSKGSKRMRLPNGFGRITELKNRNLRKPFRVMVSDGKDDNGKPIGKLLKPNAYFETYNEAYQALMDYHKNPYDFNNITTMDELYEKWYETKVNTVKVSTLRAFNASWNYCDIIKNKTVQELRVRDVKAVLDSGYRIDKDGNISYPSEKFKITIKQTLSMMLDYAVEYEMIKHNFLKDVKLKINEIEETTSHISYSDEEMKTLWDNATSNKDVQMLLIQCYMGWRPTEMCELKTSNVNMKDSYIIGGMKTAAGKERIVPIHSRIRPFIAEAYNEALLSGRESLLDLTYKKVKCRLNRIIIKYNLSPEHKPHDARKHFVTMAKKAGVDEYAIKRIVGHSIKDLTEAVYTDRPIEWLKDEIEKIP